MNSNLVDRWRALIVGAAVGRKKHALFVEVFNVTSIWTEFGPSSLLTHCITD